MEEKRLTEVYNLIYDVEQIKRFAKLINCEKSIHNMYLACRSKYGATKQHHRGVQFLNNVDIDQFVDAVRFYEIPYGSYKYNNQIIPSSVLVIYCSTNSRSEHKAHTEMMQLGLNHAFSRQKFNIYSHAISLLSSKHEKIELLTIDVDDKSQYEEVAQFLNSEKIVPLAVVETRGGYHILIKAGGNLKKLFMQFGHKHTISDTACPIPGTIQGGFPVRFVDTKH